MLPAIQPQEHGLSGGRQLQWSHHLLRSAEVWRRHLQGDLAAEHQHHREVAPRPRIRRVLDQLEDGQSVRVGVDRRPDAVVGYTTPLGAD